MLEDKLRETDWEVTQETIEEQVARESYLQWLRDQEKVALRQTSVRVNTEDQNNKLFLLLQKILYLYGGGGGGLSTAAVKNF